MKTLFQVNTSLEKVAWLYQNSTYSFLHYMITCYVTSICSDWSQHVCTKMVCFNLHHFIILFWRLWEVVSPFLTPPSKIIILSLFNYTSSSVREAWILSELKLNDWEYDDCFIKLYHYAPFYVKWKHGYIISTLKISFQLIQTIETMMILIKTWNTHLLKEFLHYFLSSK